MQGSRPHEGLSEFILPYGAVWPTTDPDAAFLAANYEVTAALGGWNRDALECATSQPRRVRPPDPAVTPAAVADVAAGTAVGDEPVEREDGEAKGRYCRVVGGIEAEITIAASVPRWSSSSTPTCRTPCVADRSGCGW